MSTAEPTKHHPVRVLIVSSHPVQYATPVYRQYSRDPRIDVTVAYCSLQGVERQADQDFAVDISWDVPLLEGYRWIHPRNLIGRPTTRWFFGLLNTGLWSLIRSGHFDVVVCHGYRFASYWIAILAAKASGAGVILSTDAHSLKPRRGSWKTPLKRLALPLVFRLANVVCAPSTRTVKFLHQLGVPECRVVLTPYAVDNDRFSAASHHVSPEEVRRGWNIPKDATVALFCGKLVSWKRPLDFLWAGAAVDDLYLIFVGDGKMRSELEAEARALGIHGRCRFLGFVNQAQLPSAYLGSDFLVLPSEHEPFGVVVNEAFACGRPAIATDACGAAGDLVRHNDTGFVVAVGDIEAISEGMRQLAGRRSLLRQMSHSAKARIAHWGPRENAEAFVRACLKAGRG